MHPIDAAIFIAAITAVATILGAVLQHITTKNNTTLDAVTNRLNTVEERMMKLEEDLTESRRRYVVMYAYTEALHNWCVRVTNFLAHHNLEFDPPPVRRSIFDEDSSDTQ